MQARNLVAQALGLLTALAIGTGCSSEGSPDMGATGAWAPVPTGVANGVAPTNVPAGQGNVPAGQGVVGPGVAATAPVQVGADATATAGMIGVQPPAAPGFDPGVGSAQTLPTQGAGALGIPCDVAAIVSERCALCHDASPKFSAPMPLMTVADFTAMAPVTAMETVAAVATARIHATETARLMPPPGTVEPLSVEQLATLSAWLEGGAQGSPEACSVVAPESPATAGGEPASGEGVPAPVDGVTVQPYQGWKEGTECYEFRAHNTGSDRPYDVGLAIDRYVGFTFTPPWQGKRWVRSFRTLVDNAQVLHHWLWYDQNSPVVDGALVPQSGAHPGASLMYGWAPGGSDMYYAPEVGPEMSGSSGYLMEVHYNSTDAGAADNSGVEICVTDTEPAHPVTRAWLGSDAISGLSATGTCKPSGNERIHIIAGTPHMHLKGKHMRVVVNRAAGGQEVVHDADFSFENQRDYPVDLWIEPGDSITTTCTFSSPATFGTGTNQEMCYWFAQHYPAGALTDAGLLGKALHGPNSCLGL